MTQWLARPWGRLAYRQHRAPGRPAVLLHGTGCDNDDWAEVLAGLPPAQPWVALEFRGHGESDTPQLPFTLSALAEDVIALLAALELPAARLVGHSLGGMVALAVAAQCPRVAELVLLEGWTRLAVVREAFGPNHHFGELPQSLREAIVAKSEATRNRVSVADWEHFWRSVVAFDAADFLARTTTPIIEVYGANDALPGAQAKLGVPVRPNIRWVWVPHAGHYLPQEAPLQVARLIVG